MNQVLCICLFIDVTRKNF